MKFDHWSSFAGSSHENKFLNSMSHGCGAIDKKSIKQGLKLLKLLF